MQNRQHHLITVLLVGLPTCFGVISLIILHWWQIPTEITIQFDTKRLLFTVGDERQPPQACPVLGPVTFQAVSIEKFSNVTFTPEKLEATDTTKLQIATQSQDVTWQVISTINSVRMKNRETRLPPSLIVLEGDPFQQGIRGELHQIQAPSNAEIILRIRDSKLPSIILGITAAHLSLREPFYLVPSNVDFIGSMPQEFSSNFSALIYRVTLGKDSWLTVDSTSDFLELYLTMFSDQLRILLQQAPIPLTKIDFGASTGEINYTTSRREPVRWEQSETLKVDFKTPFTIESIALDRKEPENKFNSLVKGTATEINIDGTDHRLTQLEVLWQQSWLLWGGFIIWGIPTGAGAYLLYRVRRRPRQNPYLVGSPVTDPALFFGRTELLEKILRGIHNNHYYILGERRSGKTSFLKRLQAELQQPAQAEVVFQPVPLDFQIIASDTFFRALCLEFLTAAQTAIQRLQLNSLSESAFLDLNRQAAQAHCADDFVDLFWQVCDLFNSQTAKRLIFVFVIDEFDKINDFEVALKEQFRSIFMHSATVDQLRLIAAGGKLKTWDRSSPFNFFIEFEISPLSPQEARALIVNPAQGIVQWDEAVIQNILQVSQQQPYEIQRLCGALVDYALERRQLKVTGAMLQDFQHRQEATGS